MNSISSFLLSWINGKGYYYQAYSNNHNMPEISIIVDNCGSQNKNNIMIHFMNMIKERRFFGIPDLHFYTKVRINNYRYHVFNSLNLLYQKQNVFSFEKWCETFNTRNNVEVIQMFHENFFNLESYLNDLYNIPDTKTVNINHVFQVGTHWLLLGFLWQGRV